MISGGFSICLFFRVKINKCFTGKFKIIRVLLPCPLTAWEPIYLWSVGLLSSFMPQSFAFHRSPVVFKDSSLSSPWIRCCIAM